MPVARRALSPADRLAAAAVSHAATAPTESLAHFQALRMRNPLRASATWWLLEDAGVPVASLVCYPLLFAVDGTVVPGHGLGAVATHPDARKRGFATELCRRAIAGAEEEGRRVGLLYSAIAPAFYERLGYRVAPAWRPSCRRTAELAASGPHLPWTPLDPRREAATLAALYERHHRGVHLHRDEAGFLRNVELNVRDIYFGLGHPLTGYVRLTVEDDYVEVVEDVVPETDRAAALRTVARLAVELTAKGVDGWFDPCPEVAPFFEDRGRATTLPMLRGVTEVADARFSSSDYF